MKLRCRKCGLVASSDPNATHCSLCNGELESSAVSVLSRITKANSDPVDAQSADSSIAKQKPRSDIRPWFVKSINRRSKGGIVFGIAAIAIGGFGGGVIRRNYPIGGSSLIAVGIATLILAIMVNWFTSAARPFWSESSEN